MPWFFTRQEVEHTYDITGEDAMHIQKSLRMRKGEHLHLCSPSKQVALCEITNITAEAVTVNLIEQFTCENEPNVRVTLYQALPKGDKLEAVVQKAVELGVTEIVPVLTSRCVSRPNEKAMHKKVQRMQKIAKQAAQQSCRGIIPSVLSLQKLKEAAVNSQKDDCQIVFYECGGSPLNEIIEGGKKSLSFFIGPEGGFAEEEIELLNAHGCKTATLGKRILRTETAPVAALSVIMYATGNLA